MPIPAPQVLTSEQSQFLQQQGFSSGLIRSFAQNASLIPLRWWIIDNSSSMSARDAHIISGSVDNIQMLDATRWEEVRRGVSYHAHVAGMFQLPTRFTMLNSADPYSPQMFGVAERGPSFVQQEVQHLDSTLQHSFPSGATPLTKHLLHIRQAVVAMAPRLQQEGKRVTIVLTTDGLPSTEQDENHLMIPEFIQALQAFQNLPVWLVVRLCTDDEKVFDFYNTLDAKLDLPYDVLDDLVGEAIEVYLHNPWLTYALPLHRMREMGFPHAVMDAIDEHALSLAELWALCGLLFANQRLPDPARDWTSFLRALSVAVAQERLQWNPVTKICSPWIDLASLHVFYNRHTPLPRDIAYGRPAPNPALMQPSAFPNAHLPSQQPQPFVQHQHQQQQRPPQQHFPGYAQQSSASSSVPPTSQFQQGGHPPPQARQQQSWTTQPSQQAPAPPPTASPPHQPNNQAHAKYSEPENSAGDKMAVIKNGILKNWALLPPALQLLRPVDELLSSIQSTFPPANGVATHAYFQKFKPMSPDALASRDEAVLKRAIRKIKFFLHPDKLPRDFSAEQTFVCKQLWDIVADAWEAFQQRP